MTSHQTGSRRAIGRQALGHVEKGGWRLEMFAHSPISPFEPELELTRERQQYSLAEKRFVPSKPRPVEEQRIYATEVGVRPLHYVKVELKDRTKGGRG